MKLSLKQKKFVDEYLESGNVSQSLIKAGYSPNYANSDGCRIIENPRVKEQIEKRLKEIESNKILTLEEAFKITSSIARGEPRKIKRTLITGEEIEEWDYPSRADMNKSLEHFYKIKGVFSEKREIEHTGAIIFKDDIDVD